MEIVVITLIILNVFTLLALGFTRIDIEHSREISKIEDDYIKEMINIREEHENGRVLFPKEKG